MPRIDDGTTDGPPGRALKTAWVTVTATEARDMLEGLTDWAESVSEGVADPEWHMHITDADGNELTIAVSFDGESDIAKPS